jgi:hypothetical protein
LVQARKVRNHPPVKVEEYLVPGVVIDGASASASRISLVIQVGQAFHKRTSLDTGINIGMDFRAAGAGSKNKEHP